MPSAVQEQVVAAEKEAEEATATAAKAEKTESLTKLVASLTAIAGGLVAAIATGPVLDVGVGLIGLVAIVGGALAAREHRVAKDSRARARAAREKGQGSAEHAVVSPT